MSTLSTPLGEWNLRIDFDACRRIRRNVGFDLLSAIADDSILQLADDLPTLSSIVWELIESAATRRSVTQERFFDSIEGEHLTAMAQAVAESISEFLPEPDPEPEDRPRRRQPPSTSKPEPLELTFCKLAARIPIEPGPYTARELFAMANAACSERWDHTASILCLTAAIHRDPKSAPRPFAKFHPYMASRSVGMTTAQLHAFRDMPGNVHVTITLPPQTEAVNDPPPPIEPDATASNENRDE